MNHCTHSYIRTSTSIHLLYVHPLNRQFIHRSIHHSCINLFMRHTYMQPSIDPLIIHATIHASVCTHARIQEYIHTPVHTYTVGLRRSDIDMQCHALLFIAIHFHSLPPLPPYCLPSSVASIRRAEVASTQARLSVRWLLYCRCCHEYRISQSHLHGLM